MGRVAGPWPPLIPPSRSWRARLARLRDHDDERAVSHDSTHTGPSVLVVRDHPTARPAPERGPLRVQDRDLGTSTDGRRGNEPAGWAGLARGIGVRGGGRGCRRVQVAEQRLWSIRNRKCGGHAILAGHVTKPPRYASCVQRRGWVVVRAELARNLHRDLQDCTSIYACAPRAEQKGCPWREHRSY